MRAHSAAPGGGTPGHGYIDGDASSLSRLGLSETIVSRLAAENILTVTCAACGRPSATHCERCLRTFPALRHLLPAAPRRVA